MTSTRLVLTVLLFAPPTRAEGAQGVRPTAKLRYARLEGAASCPSPSQTEAAVAARLGYAPFRDDAPEVIEAFVERHEAGLRARLRLIDAKGETKGKRELLSPSRDCSELSNALTLAIAIAVDPQSFLTPPAPVKETPAIAPAAPPPPVAQVIEAPVVVAPPPPPPPLPVETEGGVHLQGGVGLLGLVGTSPAPTGGFAVRLTLGGQRWSVSLDGRGEWPRTMDVGPGTVSIHNLVGLIAPCVHLRPFGFCAVAGAGVTRVSGTGLEESSDGSAPFVQIGGRVQALFELTRQLYLGGSVDVLAPITRAVILVGPEQVWASPAVNGSAGLFIAFSFT